MDVLRRIINLFMRNLSTPELYAKFLGVRIGKNCLINTRHWPSEAYLIEIGNNVQVTENVHFHTHGGAHAARRTIPNFDVFGKIKVCDWAYIGSCSHILPGVTIGEGAIIAAGSIVTKSIPSNEVWGGCPAKYISTVPQYIERNLRYNVNTKNIGSKHKKSILMALPDDKFIHK